MAELATIARPYAEALFKASASVDQAAVVAQVNALGQVAGHAELRQFAANPKVSSDQVIDVIGSALQAPMTDTVRNLLLTVIDNDRLEALPEVATQFQALVNARSGVSQALVQSAYPIDPAQLGEVVAALERRFGRKLDARVVVEPALIGGIRVQVGDEVLDTSVKARLEQMKAALTA